MEHFGRRSAVGPYHPGIEVFKATSSAPYNIESFFDLLNMTWDARGWVSAITTFRNAETLTLGKDVFRGGLVSLVYHNKTKLYTDYIENVTFRITEQDRDVILQVGDGKAREAPLAKHQRNLTGLFEAINVVTLAPQSAGFV